VEIVPYVGNPDTAVVAVVDPSTMRSQFIVEDIEADATIVVVTVIIITIIGVIIVVILTLGICAPGSKERRQQQCDYREE
jgi:hypothetical protein